MPRASPWESVGNALWGTSHYYLQSKKSWGVIWHCADPSLANRATSAMTPSSNVAATGVFVTTTRNKNLQRSRSLGWAFAGLIMTLKCWFVGLGCGVLYIVIPTIIMDFGLHFFGGSWAHQSGSHWRKANTGVFCFSGGWSFAFAS